MKNKKLNPEEVISIIDKTLSEIKNGIQSHQLSKEEATEVREGFDELFLQALKLKIKVKLEHGMNEYPDASVREVLTKVFHDLPNDIDGEMLKKITTFVVEKWEDEKLKMAA